MKLPSGVTSDLHPSGLARLRVEREACRAELFLHGATLTAWAPRGHRDVLFSSPLSVYRPDKPIRGGVPICWPWFGPRAGAAQHGFVRATPWALESVVEEGDAVVVVLALDGDGARPEWPHRFSLRYQVTLGRALACALTATNHDAAPVTYEDALHAYFAVEDVRQTRVGGLEGQPYLDRAGGGEVARRSEDAPFVARGETDRLYLGSASAVVLEDGGRRLTIAKEGAGSTVVWSPGPDKARALADLGEAAWTSMVCVEPANARQDAITLAPGASHTTRLRVAVDG